MIVTVAMLPPSATVKTSGVRLEIETVNDWSASAMVSSKMGIETQREELSFEPPTKVREAVTTV